MQSAFPRSGPRASVSGLKYLPPLQERSPRAVVGFSLTPASSGDGWRPRLERFQPAMSRGLDHIVHAARDLDALADLYRRAGFTVGARNRHPWGTHNHIVQLPGFFLELLTVAEPDKLVGEAFAALFGAYNRDFIARGEGFSLLILESK